MGLKWSICPEQNAFGKNHFYYFHLPIGPFYRAKFKKILTADPEFWQCTFFGPKVVHSSQFFFGKIITIILVYLLAPFIVQNLKKVLPVNPELWGCAIFGPKMAHFPKWELFQKTCSRALFLYSCLSTCQKSKSDINLLVKYWWLKNTEISLAKSHFCL